MSQPSSPSSAAASPASGTVSASGRRRTRQSTVTSSTPTGVIISQATSSGRGPVAAARAAQATAVATAVGRTPGPYAPQSGQCPGPSQPRAAPVIACPPGQTARHSSSGPTANRWAGRGINSPVAAP